MWVVRSGRTRGQLSLKQILKSLRTKKQKKQIKKGGKEREGEGEKKLRNAFANLIQERIEFRKSG
jgi:hypothetical protein